MERMKNYKSINLLELVLIVIITILVIKIFVLNENHERRLLLGSSARSEREYSFEFDVKDSLKIKGLIPAIHDFLEKISENDGYYLTDNNGNPSFLYVDYYLDSKSKYNQENHISYRIRRRFDNPKNFLEYNLNNDEKFIIRTQLQLKYEYNFDKNGYSTCFETRTDFEQLSVKINPAYLKEPEIFRLASNDDFLDYSFYPVSINLLSQLFFFSSS